MYERCLCGAPDCRSCGPAQGWHVHTRHCYDEDGVADCGMVAYDDYEEDEAQRDEDDMLRWQQEDEEGEADDDQ